jgi:hypothetical protein
VVVKSAIATTTIICFIDLNLVIKGGRNVSSDPEISRGLVIRGTTQIFKEGRETGPNSRGAQ